VCFEASLRELERMFHGGLSCDENPTLFSDGEEAKGEAHKRIVARDAAVAIVLNVENVEGLEDVDRIELLDAKGRVTLTLTLGKRRQVTLWGASPWAHPAWRPGRRAEPAVGPRRLVDQGEGRLPLRAPRFPGGRWPLERRGMAGAGPARLLPGPGRVDR
jgi:hypothetical protein